MLAALAIAADACLVRPLAYGEALVVVDTNVSVPRYVNRLRIDVIAIDGQLIETRELSAPSPRDWPISFSVTTDREATRNVLVRLRAYPEGHVITRAELGRIANVAPEPPVYGSIEDTCANAPELHLDEPITLRRGAAPITTVLRYTADDGAAKCAEPTKSGSVAAKIVITDKDVYRFELAGAVPEQSVGDTTLVLRKDCGLPSTQLACADDVRVGDKLSGITTELDSGTYWLVTGGREPAVADLTLLASRRDTAVEVKPPPPPPGEDANTLEPSPGATIDRLIRLQLVPGYRGTVAVTLSGECFGTAANPITLQTCIDKAGTSVIADAMLPDGPLVRDRPPPPAWDGERSEPCTATPRGPSPLLDEEVCIPGGAFLLGDNLALTDLDYRTRPEHVRVVGPFLLDRYEFTVGRYREAIRRGFAPSETPHVNNGPVAPGQEHGGCTWNFADRPDQPAANIDRESFPLNCIRWEDARALCTFFGGDLPTEDQWEYAATASGRPTETQYPWGSDLPTCDRVIVERSDTGATRCAPAYGPTPVDDPAWAAKDSTPTGVIGMGGNIQEWLATGFYPYTHPVWWRAGIRAPLAPSANDTAPLRATRGGDWADYALYATSSARRAAPPRGDFLNIGFRCARSGR